MSATRAFRIPEVCKATGLCRTTVYAAIKSGDLPARKYGRCTVILAVDLERFLNELPTTRASRAKQQDQDHSGGDEDDRKDRNSMSVA